MNTENQILTATEEGTASQNVAPTTAPLADSTCSLQPSTFNDPAQSNDPLLHHSNTPAPGAPPPAGPEETGNRRKGHIARLPKEVRERINLMLDDGLIYKSILRNLGDHGKHLDEDHVRSWKKGGYKDYLRQQEALEKCRVRQNSAFDLLLKEGRINSFQATQQLASAHICQTIAELGGDVLRDAVVANLLNYFRMLNAFSRLTTGGLKCERHLIDEQDREAKRKEKFHKRKRGISKQSVKEMTAKLNLM